MLWKFFSLPPCCSIRYFLKMYLLFIQSTRILYLIICTYYFSIVSYTFYCKRVQNFCRKLATTLCIPHIMLSKTLSLLHVDHVVDCVWITWLTVCGSRDTGVTVRPAAGPGWQRWHSGCRRDSRDTGTTHTLDICVDDSLCEQCRKCRKTALKENT